MISEIIAAIEQEIAEERKICQDIKDSPGWRLHEKTMRRAQDIVRDCGSTNWKEAGNDEIQNNGRAEESSGAESH